MASISIEYRGVNRGASARCAPLAEKSTCTPTNLTNEPQYRISQSTNRSSRTAQTGWFGQVNSRPQGVDSRPQGVDSRPQWVDSRPQGGGLVEWRRARASAPRLQTAN
eukprot:2582087-Pyramimonas_sp.AAC.1